MLNRTRIGMMIRAGVDDRAMLSASGVNVHVVFAIVFAVGAGLAGFRRRGRRLGAVGRARRGRALSAGLAGGRHRRRHGLDHRRRHRRAADRPRRADRARLFADLRHRAHLRHHGGDAGVAAAGHHGQGAIEPAPPSWRSIGRTRRWRCRPSSASAHIVLAVALLLYPLVASDFFLTQIGAYSLIFGMLGAVADAARRLWRHGQPGADHSRRRRRLYDRDLRHQQHPTSTASAGRGGCWCRSPCCSPPSLPR